MWLSAVVNIQEVAQTPELDHRPKKNEELENLGERRFRKLEKVIGQIREKESLCLE